MIARFYLLLAVFVFCAGGAVAAQQSGDDVLAGIRDGHIIYDPPMPVPAIGITDSDGQPGSLDKTLTDGKWHLIRVKGQQCKKDGSDLPRLAELQQARSADLAVLVLEMTPDGKPVPATGQLAAAAGLEARYVGMQDMLQTLGILATPVDLLIDREGRIRVKIMTNFDWMAKESLEFLDAMIQDQLPGATISRSLPVNNFTGFSD